MQSMQVTEKGCQIIPTEQVAQGEQIPHLHFLSSMLHVRNNKYLSMLDIFGLSGVVSRCDTVTTK